MKLIRLGVIWFLIWFLIASIFPPLHYDGLIFTISELAHQGYERSWILLLGFYGNGFILFTSGIYYAKKSILKPFLSTGLIIAGVAIIGMGLFQTNFDYYGIRPSDNIYFMLLHIVFALSNQAVFYVMVLYHIKHSDQDMKKIHQILLIANIIFAILFSVFSFFPFYRGIFQRFIFILSGIWFWFYFNHFKK